MDINRYLDHAVLKPEMTQAEAEAAIREGIDLKVRLVCVRPCDIQLAIRLCEGTQTEVGCVLDFPHGTGGAETKEALAELYSATGIKEIDTVMNYGLARSGQWDKVEDEIARVVKKAHAKGVVVKVIFETSMLNGAQVEEATRRCMAAGADFVKTSTGFYGDGAKESDVEIMLKTAGGKIKVKPSGGIRDTARARKFIELGADRLGVGYSSSGAIIRGEKAAAHDNGGY